MNANDGMVVTPTDLIILELKWGIVMTINKEFVATVYSLLLSFPHVIYMYTDRVEKIQSSVLRTPTKWT